MKIKWKWEDGAEYDVLSYNMKMSSGGQLANIDTVGLSLTVEAQPKADVFKKFYDYATDQENAISDAKKGAGTLTVFPGDGKGKESIKTVKLTNIIVNNLQESLSDLDEKLQLSCSLTAVNTVLDKAELSSEELKKSTGIGE